MKSRNELFTALALGLTLSAPLAFAQEQQEPQAEAAQSTDAATPAEPASQSTDATAATPATPATPASPAATPTAPGQEAKKITWSDLDADKDGKLTKDELAAARKNAGKARPAR